MTRVSSSRARSSSAMAAVIRSRSERSSASDSGAATPESTLGSSWRIVRLGSPAANSRWMSCTRSTAASG